MSYRIGDVMSYRYRFLFALRWLKPSVRPEIEERVVDGWLKRRRTGRVSVTFQRIGLTIPWFSVPACPPFETTIG